MITRVQSGDFVFVESKEPEEDYTYEEFTITPLAPFKVSGHYLGSCTRGVPWVEAKVEGCKVWIFGITEEEEREEFEKAVGKFLQPVVEKDAIHQSLMKELNVELLTCEILKNGIESFPQLAKEHFLPVLRTLEEIEKPSDDRFFYLHHVNIMLGEEFYKRIQKSLPIQWQIAKEDLPRIRELIQFQIEDKVDGMEELLNYFKEDQDYYIEEDFIPLLIPVIKMPLMPWPRVEKIKQAIRAFFSEMETLIQNLSKEDEDLLCPIGNLLDKREDWQVTSEHYREMEATEVENLRMICNGLGLQIRFRQWGQKFNLGTVNSD